MTDEPVLPQRPTSAPADVLSVEWLFEPSWRGERLIARCEDGRLSLTDAAGVPADDGFPEVVELLEAAVLAGQAVVDGIWTAQPFIGDGSAARNWADTLEREGLADEVPDPLETERRRAFVAVDLLEIDDQPLYDVPYQERRRLLESVIEEGIQIRLSPVVKQPVASWLIGWRENGFTHYLAKHQNSRYSPGTTNPDWIELSTRAEPPRGLVSRMFTVGNPRPRQIRD